MAFNLNKIKALIVENGLTTRDLASKIIEAKTIDDSIKVGLSESGLYKKLNGKSEFTRGEIEFICRLLNVPPDKVVTYFFDL